MKVLQKICFVLLLTTFSSAYGGDCIEDWDDDDCRVKAEQGNARAQYRLGIMYTGGVGVLQDNKESVKWLRKAVEQFKKEAEQGDDEAQFYLGEVHDYGRGVPEDDKKAVYWYSKAAEQGYADAQTNLGALYYYGEGVYGEGVVQDYKEAFKWYRKAAEQGYADAQSSLGVTIAQYSLGVMYEKGQGVLQDYKKAIKWYTKSAEQGYAPAHTKLGALYAGGSGGPQDYVMALWHKCMGVWLPIWDALVDMWSILWSKTGFKIIKEVLTEG